MVSSSFGEECAMSVVQQLSDLATEIAEAGLDFRPNFSR
jgi:hypothetical protein